MTNCKFGEDTEYGVYCAWAGFECIGEEQCGEFNPMAECRKEGEE